MSRSWKHTLAPAPDKPHHPGRYPLARTKKATTACEACQKRKSKCVGDEPCEPCRKAKTECKVNADNDGRRRITLKRKIESLELDRDLLVRLVEAIRNDDDHQTPDVLNLIRSNAPLEEIRLCLADGQSERRGSHPKMSRPSPTRYMNVNRIADIPLFQVPAHPWTSITQDDAFVSHLISLYFTWQHSSLNWIDRDLFLADMHSGRLDSRFCSPLLVNSMLAIACIYSDYPESFAVPGKDRQGWQYLVEISDCVRQVLHKREKMIAEANEQGEQMARSIDTAVFGLFSLNPAATLSFQTPSIIKVPKNLNRFPENHDPKDTWIPYPRQAEPVPAHTNCLLNGQLELALVAWEISDYLFGDEKPQIVDLSRIDHFHSLFEKAAANLPECIRLGNTPTPGAMDLHPKPNLTKNHPNSSMRYYHTILVMYGFIVPTLTDAPLHTQTRIKTLLMTSAHQIGTLLNLFRSNWPIECIPLASMQYATIALFTLLDDMSDEKNKAVFVEILITLRALARRWQFAKGMLRLVQLTAIKQEIGLPRDTMVLLKNFEDELWKTGEPERFSSLYPNFALSVRQRGCTGILDEVEMDRFLDEWDVLSVSGMASEDGDRSSKGLGRGGSTDSYEST
ncbi:uncharacterized protein N7515_007698 [Penicillium bovifimosum]|uniref:Zn(2)-C6 fungal-type domain-containing protein n=1 Tax=Penicillium bovifimosum TaxID=126998 RepID=A0A9W9GLK7_9EURO|nr:uncharacterized protein N7515_007698 [Penicillium bovifimosum]KAJ5123873.1 hypothetical protein N7515_007698 [Penicillium bovifimosum]